MGKEIIAKQNNTKKQKKNINRKKEMHISNSGISEDSYGGKGLVSWSNADEQNGNSEGNQICSEGIDVDAISLQEEIKAKAGGYDDTESTNQDNPICDEAGIVEEGEDFIQHLQQREEVLVLVPCSPMSCEPPETVEELKCVEDSEESLDVEKSYETFYQARTLKEEDQDANANFKGPTEDLQQQYDSKFPANPWCEEDQPTAIEQMKDSVTETDVLGTNDVDNQEITTSHNDLPDQTSTADKEREYIDENNLQSGTTPFDMLMIEDKAQHLENSDDCDKKESTICSPKVPTLFETRPSKSTGSAIHSQDEVVENSWDVDKPLVGNTTFGSGKVKSPRTPSRLEPRMKQPVSPLNSKMAEKIAVAISKEDKKFNDLMISLSGSKSGDKSSPQVRERDLVGGAFNTLSNSTNACISPTVQLQVSRETDKRESSLSRIDPSRFPRRLESELTAAVEVQLNSKLGRNVDRTPLQANAHELLKWVDIVLSAETNNYQSDSTDASEADLHNNSLNYLKESLDRPENINRICQYVVDCVTSHTDHVQSGERTNMYPTDVSNACDDLSTDIGVSTIENTTLALLQQSDCLRAFNVLPPSEDQSEQTMISADFTAFLKKISRLTSIECPIQGNPCLDQLVALSLHMEEEESSCRKAESLREKLFGIDDEMFLVIVRFLKRSSDPFAVDALNDASDTPTKHEIICEQAPFYEINKGSYGSNNDEMCVTPTTEMLNKKMMECLTSKRNNRTFNSTTVLESLKIPSPDFARYAYNKTPTTSPCPFETAVWNVPGIVVIVLGCLGDPVAVCRMKMVNKFCNRIVSENEYIMMRDSVRLGGMPNNVRPAFWMWITLEKCQRLQEETPSLSESLRVSDPAAKSLLDDQSNFQILEQKGKASKWHAIIVRDVTRAFGNLPPHKSKGSKRNSIVRALMSWGQNHLLRRHQDGSCRVDTSPNPSGKGEPIRRLMMSPPLHTNREAHRSNNDLDLEYAETVSDWGGISPTVSNISSAGSLNRSTSIDVALTGNELTLDMKADLQKKLETILDVIAAVHEELGYCQGMDYVVAHLLRVLQETIEWDAPKDKLPNCIESILIWKKNRKVPLHETEVVEETVFRVMHTLLSTYNLRHMYWPELRALKTSCRVFERLIEKKLPVLSDHFDHHELNIGMFALGWFQTCFLYIPSMPSKTINRIWDIWLVERSPKIYFRVATAILFLSQPILLNNELEGMMQYLNTFPDATIFSEDIIINCALQIKITNRMLTDIEMRVMRENELAHGLHSDLYSAAEK